MADNDAMSDDIGPVRRWLARSYTDLTDGERWTIAVVVALVVAFAAGGLRQAQSDELPLLGSASASAAASTTGSTAPGAPPGSILVSAPTPARTSPSSSPTSGC